MPRDRRPPQPPAGDGRARAVIEAHHAAGRRRPLRRQARASATRSWSRPTASPTATTSSRAVLRYRHERRGRLARGADGRRSATTAGAATFAVDALGRYRYTVTAWVDRFLSWRHDFARRVDADDMRIAARVGAELDRARPRSAPRGDDAQQLAQVGAGAASRRRMPTQLQAASRSTRSSPRSRSAIRTAASRRRIRSSFRSSSIASARASRSWYELFPRSLQPNAGRHGTFDDVEARLPYVAEMGFDVLYLPPIHPIGRVQRKGPNNALDAGPGRRRQPVGDRRARRRPQGDPSASSARSTTSARLVARGARRAASRSRSTSRSSARPTIRTSSEHPEWFRRRPDGTIQYAENPPKKYQDIYPFDFETDDWQALWRRAARASSRSGSTQGVRDLPRRQSAHQAVRVLGVGDRRDQARRIPTSIFLAEAFTRPKVMHRLAKLGFTQSYTYFTWRNTKQELTEYFTELDARPRAASTSGRTAGRTRRTSCPSTCSTAAGPRSWRGSCSPRRSPRNYGIYGPAFELLEHEPREPGSEEYLDSEKYELRHWDLARAGQPARRSSRASTHPRASNPALQRDGGLRFMRRRQRRS